MNNLLINKKFCIVDEIIDYLNEQSYLGRIKILEVENCNGEKWKFQFDRSCGWQKID